MRRRRESVELLGIMDAIDAPPSSQRIVRVVVLTKLVPRPSRRGRTWKTSSAMPRSVFAHHEREQPLGLAMDRFLPKDLPRDVPGPASPEPITSSTDVEGVLKAHREQVAIDVLVQHVANGKHAHRRVHRARRREGREGDGRRPSVAALPSPAALPAARGSDIDQRGFFPARLRLSHPCPRHSR